MQVYRLHAGGYYCSDPEFFPIMSLEQLKEWSDAGRGLDYGMEPHNSGSQPYKHRHLKHPSDPIGLVADKLGRAIANERRSDAGQRLEPVFVHVYSLAHIGPLKGLVRRSATPCVCADHRPCRLLHWDLA